MLSRQVNLETIHDHDVLAERWGTVGELRDEISPAAASTTTRPRSRSGSRLLDEDRPNAGVAVIGTLQVRPRPWHGTRSTASASSRGRHRLQRHGHVRVDARGTAARTGELAAATLATVALARHGRRSRRIARRGEQRPTLAAGRADGEIAVAPPAARAGPAHEPPARIRARRERDAACRHPIRASTPASQSMPGTTLRTDPPPVGVTVSTAGGASRWRSQGESWSVEPRCRCVRSSRRARRRARGRPSWAADA